MLGVPTLYALLRGASRGWSRRRAAATRTSWYRNAGPDMGRRFDPIGVRCSARDHALGDVCCSWSAAAGLARALENIAHGIPIYEVYGLTETARPHR